MKNLNEIETLAKKLSTQHSHIVAGTKKLMLLWEEKTKCNQKIWSKSSVFETGQYMNDDIHFHLITGEFELKGYNAIDELVDVDEGSVFFECMSAKSLRKFLSNFSKYVAEIMEEMVKIESKNVDVIGFLDSIIEK
jgi:hypothetical protein